MKNSKSLLEHKDFLIKVIAYMAKASASSALPLGVHPTAINPLGVDLKPHYDKLRLVVNKRHVNEHLVKKKVKLESLLDISNMAEND